MPEAWIGVVGAAIGGTAAIIGGFITAWIKHRSEIAQKKLEHAWKLDDEDRALMLANSVESEKKKKEILGQADKLYRLALEVTMSQDPAAVKERLSKCQILLGR